MLTAKDLYCYTAKNEIVNSKFTPIGETVITYEIHRYRDVRNLANTLTYVVICTQRILIPNAKAYQPGVINNKRNGYFNYPAAVSNSFQLDCGGSDPHSLILHEFFPRTLNASVSTGLETQTDDSSSSTVQQSRGSSTSQCNTFGVSVSDGMFGELPVACIGFDAQQSWSSSNFKSSSSGTGAGYQSGASSSASMSIKDWSAYGQVDTSGKVPTWVWAQGYPWDIVLYNQESALNPPYVALPPFVQSRLVTTITDNAGVPVSYAMPPSDLSLFGIDFTMKASWLIAFPEGVKKSECIEVAHALQYFTASHFVQGSSAPPTVNAEISHDTSWSWESPKLELSLYALDPILSLASGAAVNFACPALFTYPPSKDSAFKIVSAANNLQVTGDRFSSDMTAKPPKSGELAEPPTVTISFKIVDTSNEYALVLHHWTASAGETVSLAISVNRYPPITVLVDQPQGQGGQGNFSVIALRDLDYASVNFHDYLNVGRNTITITIVRPSGSPDSTLYTLSAIAIGQGE